MIGLWILAYIAVAFIFGGFLYSAANNQHDEDSIVFAAAMWPISLLVLAGMGLAAVAIAIKRVWGHRHD